ncbi:CvpA family protein [Pseudomethylobacillus aquaticus]|uniref:CvpA family protein n=1 Tax=Pseudomethylobacillus aquaticus TaxID=2676064 RepID=A0A3N0V646_9PROT|nr:CvpA family protein [Pseudomethylobacillus aquaticus]ROH88054.1 CvpA family protein [Pseudomethylobacillus aquaticus]
MNAFDYSIIAIVVISVILSMMRGFVRETLALLSWVIAFMVAKTYSLQFMPMLPDVLTGESMRMLVAFVLLFIASLLVVSLLAALISNFFSKVGLSSVDRLLGGLFGLARGTLVVVLLALLAGLTALPQQSWWRDAVLSAPLEALVQHVLPWLPEQIAQRISYE